MNRAEVTKALVTGDIVLARSKNGDLFRWDDIEGIQCCKEGAWVNARIFSDELPFTAVPEQPIPGWEKCSWREAQPMGVDLMGNRTRAALLGRQVVGIVENTEITWLRPVPILPPSA